MPSLLVRNVPESTVEALKARARRNRRSMEAEHRAMLERELGLTAKGDWREKARRLRELTAGRDATPSEVLIREDRDSR
ncbi:MAG: FitA-like ribbon-helix-helix domain-containing protein [Caulobacteraceae bacterium]